MLAEKIHKIEEHTNDRAYLIIDLICRYKHLESPIRVCIIFHEKLHLSK